MQDCLALEDKVNQKKFSFYIGLSSCFKGETIKIIGNGYDILNIENVTSDTESGFSDINIYYYEKGGEGKLVIKQGDSIITKDYYLDKSNLVLKVYRGKYLNKFKLDLNKGKRILIDGCDGGWFKEVNLYYYKGLIEYD